MFFTKLILLGGVTLLWLQAPKPTLAQTSPSQPAASVSPASASTRPDAIVPATEPVMTIHGQCDANVKNAAQDSRSCNTIITREQFEKLLNALSSSGQTVPEAARQNLARNYAESLALEAAARQAGFEDTPQFRETMEFVRLRTIATLYRSSLQEKYRTPSPEEVDAYYKQHSAEYERVKLARIFIPRESSSATDKDAKDAFDQKARNAADAARVRAAKGDDPATIQQDAYTALGMTLPPSTDMGLLARSSFIEKEAAHIFALNPGGVTQVETELTSYVIYKVISKETLNLEQVKAEIERSIAQQKFRNAIKAAIDAAPTEFNEQYFGPGISASPIAAPVARPAH